MVQFSLGCSYYATTYYTRFGGLRFDPPSLLVKGSVVGDLLRRLGSLWDGPEKHPLWPCSIAIVVYIYVGTSSKKRCECLERLMNMNTTTRKSQYTIKLRPSRKKRVLNPESNLLWVKNERRLSPDEMQCCGSPPLSAQLPFCPIFNIGANFRACLLPSYKLFPFTINMMWKVCELVIFWD